MFRHIPHLGLALCLLAFSGAAAQTLESSPSETFEEVIEVNLVNVFATVTDKDGNPVYDLTREDFEIREDGEPVEITNFYAVRQDKVVETVTAEIERRGWVIAPPPKIEPSETRYLAMVVDNSHITKRNRKQVFQGVRNFVRERLTSYDQMMVVSIDQDYEVVREFTNSPGDIVIAIDRLEDTVAEGIRNENSRIQLLRDLESIDLAPATARGPGGGTIPGMTVRAKLESASRNMMMQIETLARDEANRAQKTLSALQYLVSSMAGLPGRKAIVYLSDGVPMRPGETLFHAHYNAFSNAAEVLEFERFMMSPQLEATKYDLTRQFEAFAAHAQASDVMFSAIDAAGKHNTVNISAQRRIRDPDSMAMAEYKPAWTPQLDTLRTRNLQNTLELVAEETGGSVLLNTRSYGDFFGDLRNSLDNYYSLGYAAPHPKQGGQHQIRVKVKRPGLQVHARRAYHDKTWTDRLTDRVVAELLLGVGSNPLGVEVTPGAVIREEGKKLLLPVQMAVPIGNLQLLQRGADRVGNATIVLVIKDAGGNTAPPYTQPLKFKLPESEYAGAGGRLAEAVVNLLLTPGRHVIGVGVRDDVGGSMSTKMLDINITDAG